MRAAEVAAERARDVRHAAHGWRRAGFVSDEVLSRIVTIYPDDRRRFGLGFRVLAFVFTGVSVWTIVGLSFVLIGSPGRTFALGWAVILAGLTEYQRGPLKRADAGAESVTGLAAALLCLIGLVNDDSSSQTLVIQLLAWTALICAAAAWRWGERLYFLGAGLTFFGLLTQTGQGRMLWILASLILIPICLQGARDLRLAPSHRTGSMILGAVSILALYAAVHLWSWDQRAIEWVAPGGPGATEPMSPSALSGDWLLRLRPLSILATAFLPPGLLVIGWRRREPLLLYAGLILTGASLATIRLYHAVMPLSLALILMGTACLALALGVRKWLRSGVKAERDGFTADALFDHTNRTDTIKAVVAMASFTPSAQAPASPSAFEGGGGRFGGGGATGGY